jgi:hypothetical protein
MRPSRTEIAASVAPGFLMLVLFYSLAIHMRASLGVWPHSIGENGFPPALLAHAEITFDCFSILFLVNVFVLPVAIFICAIVPEWRRIIRCLSFSWLAFFICWALMGLAPKPFLYWWWD